MLTDPKSIRLKFNGVKAALRPYPRPAKPEKTTEVVHYGNYNFRNYQLSSALSTFLES